MGVKKGPLAGQILIPEEIERASDHERNENRKHNEALSVAVVVLALLREDFVVADHLVVPGHHEKSEQVESNEVAHDGDGRREKQLRNRVHLHPLSMFLSFVDYIIFLIYLQIKSPHQRGRYLCQKVR